MSIELVDSIDQNKRSKRYQKVGFNDLLLEEEETVDGVMCDIKPSGSSEDYVGMELDNVMEHRIVKTRRRFIIAALSVLLPIVLCLIVISSRTTTSKTSEVDSPSKNNPGDSNTVSARHNITTMKPTQTDDANEKNQTIGNSTNISGPNLWPTTAPLPAFDICPPPVNVPEGLPIFHMGDLVIVPEAKTADMNSNDDNKSMQQWEYSFSSMDISEEASIIAVGLSDFGNNYGQYGLVRVFAWACEAKKWNQLGQDLLGTNPGEAFGYAISSSRDGHVMAVSAIQDQYDDGNGFVEVYYLNDNRWDMLGSRMENIDFDMDYTGLGTAIDLSDIGETLAVLGVVGTNSYVTRVFSYDSNDKEWVRKGNDINIIVSYADDNIFSPSLILSEDGNELALGDPVFGVNTYHFQFETDKWVQGKKKVAKWESDDYWVNSVDTDGSGNLVAFSAFGLDVPNTVKIVDYNSGNATDVYVKDYKDVTVTVVVDVAKDGQVAAALASRLDMDDNVFWMDDYVGAMTIISKDKSDGKWKVVGEGTRSENLGVPGSFVSLSGDGTIAAVGSDSVISLYGISLNHTSGNSTKSQSSNETAASTTAFTICAPYQNTTANSHAGDLDKLPKQADEHTLSIAMSADASIVAVGIDSYNSETRGLARAFAWDCDAHSYTQLGQDLFGDDPLDGFGQSVDLSSDGKIMVVGANQPPPGKSGYVDIFAFEGGEWKQLGKRLSNLKAQVEDVGREVRISADGSTVAIHGSILASNASGYTASFLRVVENVNGKWKSKGDDLTQSIQYDMNGENVRIALSLDGNTLAVTGSYSTFMAKVYTFSKTKKNWTETIIPPIKRANKTTLTDDYEEQLDEWMDEEYSSYFDGIDIGLSNDGNNISIGGSVWEDSSPIIRVLTRQDSGNWTLSRNALDTGSFDVFVVASMAISGDAEIVAVGASAHSDTKHYQGGLFVSSMFDTNSSWGTLGSVLGRNAKDHLGARVRICNDGTLAAGSSRKGYVSFFKTARTAANISHA